MSGTTVWWRGRPGHVIVLQFDRSGRGRGFRCLGPAELFSLSISPFESERPFGTVGMNLAYILRVLHTANLRRLVLCDARTNLLVCAGQVC